MTRLSPTEPEILAFQAECDGFYPPDAVDAPIAQQRAWYDALCRRFDTPYPQGLTAEDGLLAGVPVRRYRPATRGDAGLDAPSAEAAGRRPVILYFHGGGFVVGSLDSHDGICADLAEASGLDLVATDYRLLPEHAWPASADDAYAVARALIVSGRRLIVAGDSAGGTLAAGLALRARDAGLVGIVGQVLIYPGLGGHLTSGSYIEMAEAPGLTTADVRYYRTLVGAAEEDAIAHPLRAESFAGLPPAYMTAAHFDPLRDDARRYAARLAEAGIDVTFREEPQMVHAWLRARRTSPGAAAGFEAICQALRRLADQTG
ncbi:alpha/beta hydrolase [Aurantimonas sp. MSK8Z-1]|uniref:alpha/beta hydrolase n=1 Tax=Mangrovibrevibacter kandeliae TaxID=2968473 RepID=UPI00211827F9|nr:alpha/beta hydrolase [Aurantimonas sp. MSK8Z-1]MCW4115353.1 alpha/beta hydrolase [Aurantimonas sp. MSK8Z-1]